MKKILNYREKADKEFWDARKSNERNLVDIMKRKRKNMEDKRELTDINYQGKKEKHGESEEMFTQEDDDSIWSREVAVDISEMYAVDFLCRTDSTVKAGVELLIYALRSGGLSVTMDLFGAKVKLSQDHQKVFDIEWSGIFLKDLIWSLLVFGFAVVNLVPSNVKKGEYVPIVVQHTTYMLTFVDRFDRAREYRVYPLAQGAGYNFYQETRGKGASARFNPDQNVGVYVLYPPHSSNGALTSPLATVYEKLLLLGFSWENYARADYWNANPMWGIQSIQQRGTPEPNETANIAEKHMALYVDSELVRMEEQERKNVVATVQVAEQLHVQASEDVAAASSFGRYGHNPTARVPPYRYNFSPGVNRQIIEPPRPSYNSMMSEMIQHITAAVAGVLGIPPQFLASSQIQHAANAELNLRIFDKTVRDRQHDVEPILQDLFEKAYKYAHKNYRKQVFDEIRQSEEDEDRHESMAKSQQKGQSIEQYIRSTGEPSQSGLTVQGEASTSDQIKVSKIMGRDFTTGPDGRPKRPKFGFARPPANLTDEKLKELVASNVQFRIAFRRTPLTDLESLDYAYQNNIIDYDEYAEDVGAVIGVDKNHVLTEEEHFAQQEKKTKIESELVEKYGIEEEEGEGGASGGAAKKKPATKPKAKASPSAVGKDLKKSGAKK